MIDITLYQNKLELLKEWIADRVDGKISPPIWVNLDAMPFNLTIDQVLKIWQQTGNCFFRKQDVIDHPAIPVSFEEYYRYKEELKHEQCKIN